VVKPVAGEVVVIPFPRPGGKRRPALVLVDLAGADLILCQIRAARTGMLSPFHWIIPISNTANSRSRALFVRNAFSPLNTTSFFTQSATTAYGTATL
jgi:hypothetical protein